MLLDFGHGIGIRWYGLAYVTAFFVGYLLYVRLARQGLSDLAPEKVGDFIAGVAFFGVLLGGRLGYMLFYDLGNFLANPLILFKVWDGGMASHGGIIGVFIFALIYAKRNKLALLNLCDSLVVVAPLGLFFGRLANFINGELFGRVTSVSWAVQFPRELEMPGVPPEMVQLAVEDAMKLNLNWNNVPVIIENARRCAPLREQLAGTLSPRHPSQIYEALLEGAFLFALLWILRTRFRVADGVLTGLFFITYAIVRIICEMFREPDAPLTGFLTRGQFLSLFMIVVGIVFFVTSRGQKVRGPARHEPS